MMFSINIFVKVLLRSINYKHCKRFIESDQNFPLQFYVKSGEIGKILLVTRLENYHSAIFVGNCIEADCQCSGTYQCDNLEEMEEVLYLVML